MAGNVCRVLSPTAILGYGFPEESFARGVDKAPHLIAVDAGSTDPACAVKITMVRPVVSGAPGDTDVYGAQQHAPLLGLKIPLKDAP